MFAYFIEQPIRHTLRVRADDGAEETGGAVVKLEVIQFDEFEYRGRWLGVDRKRNRLEMVDVKTTHGGSKAHHFLEDDPDDANCAAEGSVVEVGRGEYGVVEENAIQEGTHEKREHERHQRVTLGATFLLEKVKDLAVGQAQEVGVGLRYMSTEQAPGGGERWVREQGEQHFTSVGAHECVGDVDEEGDHVRLV